MTMLAVALTVGAAHETASAGIGSLYRTEDWAVEKHVPAIDCPDAFVAGEATTVTVTVGKEISHPNSTSHHIRWIRLYFVPAESTQVYELGSFEMNAHGTSPMGADQSTLYTDPKISVDLRTGVAGTLYATAYCNIHGLWESSKKIVVVEPAGE